MSLYRKFSLDSSVSSDSGGVLGTRKKSNYKINKKYRSEERADLQEQNQGLNGRSTIKEKIILDDSAERQDGVVSNNSFKKHNVTFHKLFPEIPEEDELTHNFVCALQKEVLYYGRLYLSEKYVCFHSSVLLKDTKVVIPLSSLQEVKKHSQTLSVLSIQTADGEKYFFVSLRNREMCYSLLHGHCAHQQETSTGSPSTSSQDSKDHGDGKEPSRRFEDQRDELGSELVRKEPSRTRSSSKEAEQASSWLWRVMEDVNSLFSHLHSLNFSTVFYVYVVLLLLLLLVSAYMVLRMMALEEQLNFLGALAKFPPRHTDFSGQSQAKGL
ncbi:GRAM domain-containing protein 2B-like isoform X4 [Nerophis ophidion]|uniref:GRAM domain-containing protein 2B-like isoform X4 n=1 Tax=Nerophis ophidion TaxID=159077 RepID=UPI002ADF37D6|nr:GRAM domain-containing protein 2B-like isoform X4 [Nerophis ophidion]